MCRWLAYSGADILLEDLLYKPKNSLIDQSMSSKSAETPTNADGFGVGWYSSRPTPGLFRSIRPAWNDFNFRDLAAQIESHLFLAHVRATSLATVQETNCHPFRWGNWLFVHNGEIFEIDRFRKRLVEAVADELFPSIMGTTDSELMFYLALSFGLEQDPHGALERMAGYIEAHGRAAGVDQSLWMTVCATDGVTMHAVRYASDGKAPTLFRSKDMDVIYKLRPDLADYLEPHARLIASEPTGKSADLWLEVPQSSYIRVIGEQFDIKPFKPQAPALAPRPPAPFPSFTPSTHPRA